MTNELATEKHVLVVDDEPDFAALVQAILLKAHYTVTVAYNCEEALEQVRDIRPDIITLDMQMPRKSGALFYRTLKSDEQYRDIPVVVLTAVTVDDTEMKNLLRGLLETEHLPPPAAYLEKPIESPELLATLQEILSPSQFVGAH